MFCKELYPVRLKNISAEERIRNEGLEVGIRAPVCCIKKEACAIDYTVVRSSRKGHGVRQILLLFFSHFRDVNFMSFQTLDKCYILS